MDNRLYELMNWPRIEALVYSEEDEPQEILGPHKTEEGILVQAFLPTAVKMTAVIRGTGKEYEMELADEGGFFAVLLPGKTVPEYFFRVEYDNGVVQDLEDAYRFQPKVYSAKDLDKFEAGIHYTLYEKMGAHPMTIKGVEGTYFSVWAPNACRVSVVGDFNLWDGRRHPMRRIEEAGIFELFIPGIGPGACYKYEIKTKSGLPMLKADPYANAAELRPHTASVIADLSGFAWTDEGWLEKRKKTDYKKEPLLIYEVHLGSWRKPEKEEWTAPLTAAAKEEEAREEAAAEAERAGADASVPAEETREFYNYREIAPMLADYVKDMGYTHVELMPIMEHPLDESWAIR